MAQIYRTVVGNNAPSMVITCKRDGTAIDVTGATVTLAIRNERTGATTNTGAQSCTLTTPLSGIVTYAPAIANFPSEGRYIGDIKIVYSGGTIEHIPEVLLVLARGAIS